MSYVVVSNMEFEIGYLKGLSKPRYKAVAKLEQIHKLAFADVLLHTHVITGSLKLSGKSETNFDGDDWTGTIKFGGQSSGPNNPVNYAVYEQARGGDHDFMAPMAFYEDAYEDAIEKWTMVN